VKINPSVVCEQVGDDVVVLDSENSAVLTLTGDSAAVVRRLLAGETISDTEPGLQELLAQGVLVVESSKGPSRRGLLLAGASVAVGTVVALSLPSAAMAASAGLPAPILTPDGLGRVGFIGLSSPAGIQVISQVGFFKVNFDFNPSFDYEVSFDNVTYILLNIDTGDDLLTFDTGSPPYAGGDVTVFLRAKQGAQVSVGVQAVLAGA